MALIESTATSALRGEYPIWGVETPEGVEWFQVRWEATLYDAVIQTGGTVAEAETALRQVTRNPWGE